MKLGISSLGHLIDHTIAGRYESLSDLLINATEACLRFAEQNGFDVCEILLDPPEISADEDRKRFIDLCNSFPIKKQIHGPFLDLSMCSHNSMISKASVDAYIDAAKICEEIGANVLTVHPGTANIQISSIRTYNGKQLIKAVNELLNATSNMDVHVCIENMPKDCGILLDEREIDHFFSALNRDDLFFTYDTSHFWTNRGDVELLWKEFRKRIKNIHLAENFDRETDTHPRLGSGKIDFRRIFEIVQKYEYNGAMVIETYSASDLPQSIDFIGQFI